MTTLAVSVVVPVYDTERFVGACLESILGHDPAPEQVIVVDDGSADGSAAIAEGHAGVQVLRRRHEGIARTRNAGLAAATGDLIAWCDADDAWLPGKLRRQVAFLDEHPACDIVLARMDHTFEDGAEWPRWLRRDQRYGDLDGVSMSTGVFRREVFDRVEGFRDVPGTEFDLLIRARSAGCTMEVLDDVVQTRRIHDRNTMTTSDEPELGAATLMPAIRQHMRRNRSR